MGHENVEILALDMMFLMFLLFLLVSCCFYLIIMSLRPFSTLLLIYFPNTLTVAESNKRIDKHIYFCGRK